MKLTSVKIKKFKRFDDLSITGIPASAKLVILAGPNGSGKSSVFDAFRTWLSSLGLRGASYEPSYHDRPGTSVGIYERVQLQFNDDLPSDQAERRKCFYMRSAYRNDPQFQISTLSRVQSIQEEHRFNKMIENDAAVSLNYQRLTSQALEDAFVNEPESTTLAQFRERVLGELSQPLQRLFPDLILSSLGNPLQDGTFYFKKGSVDKFSYQNLSGGEKAAFDLLLDLTVKKRFYDNTVFCIDEPEAHMNSRVQGALLRELVTLLPTNCQLWLATHSIGMMRAARDLELAEPGSVIFVDFAGHEFDQPVRLTPVKPTRLFWESALGIALDDLAQLVTPEQVIICEGNPAGAVPSKNAENDETCYNIIFAEEFPQTMFLSAGNSHDVVSDRLVFTKTIQKLAKGLKVTRLIDRDDHSPDDVARLKTQSIHVLSRRNIECYLFDDEVLQALCKDVGKESEFAALKQEKHAEIAALASRQKAPDDLASAAGSIYVKIKHRLGLTATGNTYAAFMRYKLAPLLKPHMQTYKELRKAIFDR
jgi:hypothetical protein